MPEMTTMSLPPRLRDELRKEGEVMGKALGIGPLGLWETVKLLLDEHRKTLADRRHVLETGGKP